MIKDDTLWKGILENVFDDFLRFFFDEADQVFDIAKGFQFLDKELEEIFPSDDSEAPKFVDKLVKVFTKAGDEEWMLVHIEVQGYNDRDFARRMFTYFYRILDKFDKPVTAIAIFTDKDKKFCPDVYQYEKFGTSNVYRFKTFKILGQDEIALAKNTNPFAVIILTVLLALKRKNVADEDLLQLKLEIFKNLYRRNIDKKKMRGLMAFLKLYVHFAKPETIAKFEQATQIITENKNSMDIIEMVIQREKKKARIQGLEQGLEQGIEKGIEQGREEGIEKKNNEIVKNLLVANKFTITEIANFANVAEAFVRKVKKSLKGI